MKYPVIHIMYYIHTFKQTERPENANCNGSNPASNITKYSRPSPTNIQYNAANQTRHDMKIFVALPHSRKKNIGKCLIGKKKSALIIVGKNFSR